MPTFSGKNQLIYTGTFQPDKDARDEYGHPLRRYLPDPALIDAVNIAIALERPLLIKGEPGCGKTRLAYAVACEFGLQKHYRTYHVKSTSRAQDVLYTYDTIGRLRDTQLASLHFMDDEDIPRIKNPETYINYGPLGIAFRDDKRNVVLIDEIDKADIDFPNDLLQVLDEQVFTVTELGSQTDPIIAKHPPIVFITSNDERDLPDAFLRRCLFHYITFPTEGLLVDILEAHFPEKSKLVMEKVVSRFQVLREQMIKEKGMAGKKVSTSELIDWFKVLSSHPNHEISMILDGELPYADVLLKSWDDHLRFLHPPKENY